LRMVVSCDNCTWLAIAASKQVIRVSCKIACLVIAHDNAPIPMLSRQALRLPSLKIQNRRESVKPPRLCLLLSIYSLSGL